MKSNELQINSPIQELKMPLLEKRAIRLFIKRDDLIHPQISGNKWRKLKYNISATRKEGKDTLLTFGGAYSNHIYATAAAGKLFNFKTIGLIRGERQEVLNPTLQYAKGAGMQLHYIPRVIYKQRKNPIFLKELGQQFGSFFLIPEGGTNKYAIRGCAELVDEVEQQLGFLPDYWSAACGTGGTLSGIIAGLQGRKKVIGFSVLKGNFHQQEVQTLLEHYQSQNNTLTNWSIQTAYHFGGYAKFKPALIQFINQFHYENNIALDPIYTGKLFFGIFDLIEKGTFGKDTSILVVHSGGLQGIEGFNQRFGNLIDV